MPVLRTECARCVLPVHPVLLSAGHLSRCHHRRVLFLESVADPLLGLQPLVHTAHDAVLLLRAERLGGEIVDAIVEALLDHAGVHLGGVVSIAVAGIRRGELHR
jgi:hypothetical protein